MHVDPKSLRPERPGTRPRARRPERPSWPCVAIAACVSLSLCASVASCVSLSLCASVASAQSSIRLDDTLPGVSAGDLIGPDYLIDETHGARVGNNQFHSFERFGLAPGESATFDGPPTVERFISRVTGGEVTSIEGVLRTNVEGADLFLLNPSGIVVGDGGALDVPGDVTLSTADELTLGGGAGRYSATAPLSSVLSSTPVTSFGFLSGSPAPISVQGAELRSRFDDDNALLGHDLALIGGDLEIRGTGDPGELTLLYSAGGQITLAAMGSTGSVDVAPGAAAGEPTAVTFHSDGERGDVFIGDRAVVSSGGFPPDVGTCGGFNGCVIANGSGDVVVFGRDLTLDAGEIRAFTVTDRDAGTIAIDLSGDLRMTGTAPDGTSSIASLSGFQEVFPGEQILTFRETFDLPEGSYSFEVVSDFSGNITRVTYPGTGRAGDIRINAANVSIEGASDIQSDSLFGGDAGEIRIEASGGLIRVDGAGLAGDDVSIFSNARDDSGTGNAGNGGPITLIAEELRLENRAGILSEVRDGDGNGGDITIEVARLRATNDARIDSSTRGGGSGGDIVITASEDVLFAGRIDPATFPGVSTLSQPEATGDAGEIRITTPLLQLRDGARVTTTALGSGNAGTIDLRAGTVDLASSEITAEANTGEGGDIYVNGGPVTVGPDGGLSVDTPPGVVPGQLLLLSDSEISTSVSAGLGGGGDLALAATSVVLIDSRILAEAVGGNGGNIRIEASSIIRDETSDIDADSALAEDGLEDFTSPEVVIRVERPDPPAQIRDATAFLRDACAARDGGAQASLVLQPHSGLAPAPAGPLALGTPVPTPADQRAEVAAPPPAKARVAARAPAPLLVRVTCPG